MPELLVKDTKLINIRRGDLLLYKAEGLLNGDFLGELIATFEGGTGRYTHAAVVRDVPDPNAPVYQVTERDGAPIFKVKERQWTEEQTLDTPWSDENSNPITNKRIILRNTQGVKLEATWPKCRQWVISEWDSEFLQVFRVRYMLPQNIEDMLKFQADMAGGFEQNDGWDYNVAEFLTFGLLNQAAAKICSQFFAEPVYNSTLIHGCKLGDCAIALTPDLRGIRDPQITPNDLQMSGFVWPVPFQGLLQAA